jgi:hypothetical protein
VAVPFYLPLGVVVIGLATLIWWWRLPQLRGTTLGAPWFWCWLSVVVVALGELTVVGFTPHSEPWAQPLRFAAASSLFCSTVSLLGAKRPQDSAWNFIVFSLWGVLALPAIEVAFLGKGEDLQLQDIRAWFLWILIGLELSQRLGTRYWWVSLGLASCQFVLLARYLPLVRWETPESLRWCGLFAAVLAMAGQLRSRPSHARSFDRLWLDYRDLFGVAWGLRVMERINAAADRYRWPFRLHWQGFESSEAETDASMGSWPAETSATLEQTMRNLLRRFVSDAWISERLGHEAPLETSRKSLQEDPLAIPSADVAPQTDENEPHA